MEFRKLQACEQVRRSFPIRYYFAVELEKNQTKASSHSRNPLHCHEGAFK